MRRATSRGSAQAALISGREAAGRLGGRQLPAAALTGQQETHCDLGQPKGRAPKCLVFESWQRQALPAALGSGAAMEKQQHNGRMRSQLQVALLPSVLRGL